MSRDVKTVPTVIEVGKKKRSPKPPMTQDTATIVDSLLPFLQLNHQTATAADYVAAIKMNHHFREMELTSRALEKNEEWFLKIQLALCLGKTMIESALHGTAPNQDLESGIAAHLEKMRPTMKYLPSLGCWSGVLFEPGKNCKDAFDAFLAHIVKTIGNSFSKAHTIIEDGETAFDIFAKPPNGYFYIGLCPRCQRVFPKKRSDELYDRKTCQVQATKGNTKAKK